MPARTTPVASPPASPAGAPPFRPRGWRRLEDFFFPRNVAGGDPSGLLQRSAKDRWALVAALGLAVGVALYLERVMFAHPVPPGGDPGEWLTSSYPWVGLPYPTWIIPGQYPPGTFPILGSLVRISGNPLTAARMYVGLVTVLLGTSTFVLARAVLRSWTIPLLVEGFVLLNPSFMLMYFFGAYPNLLGFVFMNLAVAFAVRFVRSHQPVHILVMWLATTAAVLTHSLVAVVLLGTLSVFGLIVLSYRRIPRALYRSRAGQVGIAVFGLGAGGFYLFTRLLGVPHPQYFQASSFAHLKNGPGHFIYLLTRPALPHAILPTSSALLVLGLVEGLLLFTIVYLRVFKPERLTVGGATVASLILVIVGMVVIGWELSIISDYVRLAYFLIMPLTLAIGLIVDSRLAKADRRAPVTAPLRAGRIRQTVLGGVPLGRLFRRRVTWGAIGFAVGAALLIVMFDVASVPAGNRYELAATQVGHDQAFLNAVQFIKTSGIPGSVLTVSGAVKWTRALTARNAHAPYIPGHYSFDQTHIDDGELSYFAVTDRYAVTNNLVAEAVSGTSPEFLNSSPVYEVALYGTFSPLLRLPPGLISVTSVSNGTRAETNLSGPPLIVLPPNNQAYLTEVFNTPTFHLTISLAAIPGLPEASMTVTAYAASSTVSLLSLHGTLLPPLNHSSAAPRYEKGTQPGQFLWSENSVLGHLVTTGSVTPVSALAPQNRSLINATGPQITLDAKAPKYVQGVPSLSFSVLLSTPKASNLINNLPPFLSTPVLWANWSARFLLYSTLKVPLSLLPSLAANEAAYLEAEFGARVVYTSGEWSVLLLPT